jgi:hypothetical protein
MATAGGKENCNNFGCRFSEAFISIVILDFA